MSNIYDKSSLVLIPSGTKTGKVYSQKPVSGDGDFTFTRSSAATRVNADGNIEKETQNLLLQSNSFDTTWSKSNSPTLTSGQSGYDGSSNAWLLSKPAASFVNINQNVSISGVFTYSVYLKAGTNSTAIVRALGSTDSQFFVDLSNGTSTFASTPIIDYVIEDVGGGWYRTSISVNDSGSVRFFIYPEAPFGNTTAGNIYIQDAQLEQGLVARDYIETTTTAVEGGITDNVPRLDYTDSSCPALLLEPQRTNLVPNGDYIKGLRSRASNVVTSNYGISPEGVQNSTRIQAMGGDGYQYFTYSVNPSTTYAMSVYAKGSGSIRFNFYDGTSAQTSNTSNLTSEWDRYTFIVTSNSTTSSGDFGFFIPDDAEVYGFQFEQGSYATSYIPTYGSSVTRGEDYPSQLDATGLTSTYNTLYTEFEVISTTHQGKIALSDNSSANRMTIYQNYGDLLLLVSAGGVSQATITATSVLSVGTNFKVAVKNQNGSHALFINGTKIGEQSSTTPTGLNKLRYGNEVSTIQIQKFLGDIKQTLVLPQALSDAECIDLTTI